MGTLIKSSCKCGYHDEMMIGGSMATFRQYWGFPHNCQACGLVKVNMVPAIPECPKCLSTDVKRYGFKSLQQSFFDRLIGRKPKEFQSVSQPIGNSIAQFWDYHLTQERNFCPACGEMTLRFSTDGDCYD